MKNTKKLVADQKEWDVVARELEGENLKLASYDNTLMNVIGDVNGKKVLDYGAGPGVLALGLQKMGANVKVWDTGIEMQEKSALKIGKENVYTNINTVPSDYFDVIICNLVLCIVPEEEAKSIVENMKQMLAPGGFIYIGFCNPKIFQIAESNLDYRLPTSNKYEDNHDYRKVKKEGNYEIIESHRPIEWYEKIYTKAGLQIVDTLYTPEYELKGQNINDFIIFKLQK